MREKVSKVEGVLVDSTEGGGAGDERAGAAAGSRTKKEPEQGWDGRREEGTDH